ncbi:MAG: hypothetical protein ACREBJ_10995, partial [Nitrosotalea sp.]
EAYHLEKDHVNKLRTIDIDNLGVATYDFGVDPLPLLQSGEQTATEAVANFTGTISADTRFALESSGIKLPQKYPSELRQFATTLEPLRSKLLQENDSPMIFLSSEGTEKREVAISFKNRFADEFSRILWITPENRYSVYKALAETLLIEFHPSAPLDELRTKVHSALEQHKEKKPYLFIFENFKETPPLPQGTNGRFIILADRALTQEEEENAYRIPTLTNAEKEYLYNNYFKELYEIMRNPNCESKEKCLDLDQKLLHPREVLTMDVIDEPNVTGFRSYLPWPFGTSGSSYKEKQEALRFRFDDPKKKLLVVSTNAGGAPLPPRDLAEELRKYHQDYDLKYKAIRGGYNEICHELKAATDLGPLDEVHIQGVKSAIVPKGNKAPFSECLGDQETKPKIYWEE